MYFGGPRLSHDDSLRSEQLMTSSWNANEQLYKTGQWARWELIENSKYPYLQPIERVVGEVMIRGQRINLLEVSNHLKALSIVTDAEVVISKDHEGHKCMAAYVLVTQKDQPDQVLAEQIQQELKKQLASVRTPSVYVLMDSLERDDSGQLDYSLLPEALEQGVFIETFVAPETDTERQMCGIWQQLLSLERVGAEDDFFLLGGHSLLATRLINQIRESFDVELPLKALFEQPTITELCKVIDDLIHINQTKENLSELQADDENVRVII